MSILRDIYKPGYAYQKAGVVLMDLAPAHSQQLQVFSATEKVTKSQKLMQLMNAANAAWDTRPCIWPLKARMKVGK